MTTPAPARFGRYDVLGELGRGTTAVVYKAWDAQLDRLVAVKIFRPDIGSLHDTDASLKRRFQQEAMAAGRLTHPSIVAIYDVGELDGTPYIVMEYVDGRTLADVMAACGPLTAEEVVPLVLQVCEALQYAHRHGVVHRDIKPGNILVGPDGVPKLTDFGIARIAGMSHTHTRVLLGTPSYMSPEQVRGQAADARSDVFAVGVVLYEALCGVTPFSGDELASVLYQIVHADPVPLRQRAPTVTRALEAVVARALAKDRESRFMTAQAFAAALEQALRSPQVVVHAPGGARGHGAIRRRHAVAAAALAVLFVAAMATWAGSSRLASRAATPPSPIVPAQAGAEEPVVVVSPPPSEPTVVPSPPSEPAPSAVAPDPSPSHRAEALATERLQLAPLRVDRAAPRVEPAAPRVRPVAPRVEPAPLHAEAPAAPPSGESGCLAVNAIPFATVVVDGRVAGTTPKACVRVAVGEHRVHFRGEGEQRSPERVVRVTPAHGAEAMRLSYDFKSGRFVEE